MTNRNRVIVIGAEGYVQRYANYRRLVRNWRKIGWTIRLDKTILANTPL